MLKKLNNKILVKISISAVLISLILSKLDWSEFYDNAKSIRLSIFVIAVVLAFLEILVRALRWRLLLRVKGIKITMKQSISFILVGTFWGIFLPSSFGGDIAKMYDFSKYSSRTSDTVSSVFMERWSGVVSLSIISVSIVLLSNDNAIHNVRMIVLAVFGGIVVSSLMIFRNSLGQKLSVFLGSRQGIIASTGEKIKQLISSIQEYKKYKMVCFHTLLLALVINFLRIVMNFVNAHAAGFAVPFQYFLVFIPLIILIMMIPASISGIGVREGSYLYFFSQVGMSPADAVMLSWLGFILVLVYAVAGGVLYAFRRGHRNA